MYKRANVQMCKSANVKKCQHFGCIWSPSPSLRFILTKFEIQGPTLNKNDNGSLYREPFYFDIFDLRYMLNLISTLTLTFVTDKKKVLPKYQFEEDKVQFKKKGALLKEFLNQIFYLLLRLLPKLMPSEIFV